MISGQLAQGAGATSRKLESSVIDAAGAPHFGPQLGLLSENIAEISRVLGASKAESSGKTL